MKIVLATVSSNPEFNANCDVALVELTSAYAKLIVSRMEALVALAASDEALSEGHFWDDRAEYFEAPHEGGDGEPLVPIGGMHRVLDEGAELPARRRQRVEYRHMVIAVSGGAAEVYWRASPKNVSIYVETSPLPRSMVEAVAESGSPAAK